jgi:hypothetical protein
MKTPKQIIVSLTLIARRQLNIKTLDYRGRDHLDFHEVYVLDLKAALEDAYNQGVSDTKALANDAINDVANRFRAWLGLKE